MSRVLQMSRSASTFSLSDSSKNGALVQRSNSLDHPPIRARVPVCTRTPCSPARSPAPNAATALSQNLYPNYCPSTQERKSILHAPSLTHSTQSLSSLHTSQQAVSITRIIPFPAVRNSKAAPPKSSPHASRQVPSIGLQPRPLAPHPVCVKGKAFSESCRDSRILQDPHKAVLTSPRKETLL